MKKFEVIKLKDGRTIIRSSNNIKFLDENDKTNLNDDENIHLKDGRILFTRKNGFEFYVKLKNGKIEEVTEEWFKKSINNRITRKWVNKMKM